MKKKNISNIFNLKNKNFILTGSAGRLGHRFAEVLSAMGANVALVDIDSEKNTKLGISLRKKYSTNPLTLNLDITKESDVIHLVQKALKKYKKIDGLINNAHLLLRDHPQRDASFENYPLELWDTTTLNLKSVFLCSREVGKVMSKQQSGIIVNISSIYGIKGADQRIYGKSRLNSPVSYAVAKGGIVNLTRYLAAYWRGKNIRVNTLTLGGVLDKKLQSKDFIKKYSNKTIIGRMANTDDYDGALLFLVSDASSYMTGSNLIIDGGWTAW